MKRIIFFNHWHNGDLFTTRGMAQDIISQLGTENEYYYAHRCHPKLTADFSLTLVANQATEVLYSISDQQRYAVNIHNSYFINTWIGSWMDFWQNDKNTAHPNFNIFYSVFNELYNQLNENFGFNLKLKENILDYFPSIDYTKYPIKTIDNFLNERKDVILFSNNEVRSRQSSVGDLKIVIEKLALIYKNITFVATCKFPTDIKNIFFTSDIIREQSDLCETAYLSEKCKILVTKNSSPGSYFHTNKNINDPDKVIISLSNKSVENLLHEIKAPIKYKFTDSTENDFLIDYISKSIDEKFIKI